MKTRAAHGKPERLLKWMLLMLSLIHIYEKHAGVIIEADGLSVEEVVEKIIELV